jgi:hypothetical protein
MHVEVDQTWCDDLSGGIEQERPVGIADVAAHCRNLAFLQVHVRNSIRVP